MDRVDVATIMEICADLRRSLEDENCQPWARQMSETLDDINNLVRKNQSVKLCFLAECWRRATDRRSLGETYPSYAFLLELVKRPELDLVAWSEKLCPLPLF